MSFCTENELSLVRYIVVRERHGFVENCATVEKLQSEIGWVELRCSGTDPIAQVLLQFLHCAHSGRAQSNGRQVDRLRDHGLRG